MPGLRVTRAELLARVKAHVAREVPAAAIKAEGDVKKLLGLFPTGEDFEVATFGLLEAELAGYYEPADGTMYMATDLDDADAQGTLWHELAHALEDQHWDLRARPLFVAGHTDLGNVTSSLAEGDATAASVELMLSPAMRASLGPDAVQSFVLQQLAQAMDTGPAARFPRSLRREVLAPYVDGIRFVSAVRRIGGWRAVDAVWDDPPASTEQLLHVEKYRAHEAALSVAIPPAPQGFTRVEADVYGEAEVRNTFEEWMTPDGARTAASGWGGDRLALFHGPDGSVALAWRVRFDDASPGDPDAGAFAARAFAAVAAVLPRLGDAKESGATAACVERSGNGALRAERRGRDLVLMVGGVVPAAGAWRPVMGCDAVRAWSDASEASRAAR